MLKIFSRSADHLDELLRYDLSKLPGVERLSTAICLKTIKRHGNITDWALTSENRPQPGRKPA
jgi:Lrp/AsnC family leucine-responsive transcriptional regulator